MGWLTPELITSLTGLVTAIGVVLGIILGKRKLDEVKDAASNPRKKPEEPEDIIL